MSAKLAGVSYAWSSEPAVASLIVVARDEDSAGAEYSFVPHPSDPFTIIGPELRVAGAGAWALSCWTGPDGAEAADRTL